MIRNHGLGGSVFPGLIEASRSFVWRLPLCEVRGIAWLGLGLRVISELAPVHRELRVDPDACVLALHKAVSNHYAHKWRTQEFCSGGGQQIQLTEDRENRDLEAVAP